MRLDLLAAAAMSIGMVAGPTLANEDYSGTEGHVGPYVPYEDIGGHGVDSMTREVWLADCRQRLSGRGWEAGENSWRARDECEAYLDDYYARYALGGRPQPHRYLSGSRYAYPYANLDAGQPMMMVPALAEPKCTESVEYVYEDIPARPAPWKRYIPRRSKAAPDKRVPIR